MTTTGKVITTGIGTSGAIARRMAHLLSLTGTPALYVHPSDGVHGSLGAVAVGDTVLALSKGGDSDEVNTFASRASVRGARVVAVTTQAGSPLATIADVVVALPGAEREDPGGIIAMGSTLTVAALGDAVALTLMRLRGYSWSDVLYAHPGGAVGKRAERGGAA
jgi:arabinose-5-phosphate isomerase